MKRLIEILIIIMMIINLTGCSWFKKSDETVGGNSTINNTGTTETQENHEKETPGGTEVNENNDNKEPTETTETTEPTETPSIIENNDDTTVAEEITESLEIQLDENQELGGL